VTSRELVVLGTASQTPTRTRNHNGYLLRWGEQGFLFDPGEGTQRQLLLAGAPSTAITRICLTHFHGDHCLGVPGILARMSLDRVPHRVGAHFPRSGRLWWHNMRHASAFADVVDIVEHGHAEDGPVAALPEGTLSVRRLDHRIEAFGYRFEEPDGRRMLPEKLAEHGITGPAIRRIQDEGALNGVSLADVSAPRRGQSFAFVMDTRLCAAVHELAAGVDLLVIESTFLAEDEALAREYRHLTARQAGRVAAVAGVRRLVLTHFSQRYPDPERFAEEAAAEYGGEIVVASDLDRVPLPSRRA
jgi:ribonuclease Z